MDIVVVVSTILAAFAAVAAFWAAWEARKSAKSTQDAAEASLVVSFFDQYFDPGMAEALRVLAGWNAKKGKRFAEIWIKDLKRGTAEARAVDDARRKVKGFFHKATRLHFAGVIRPTTLRELDYVAGLNIYLDVIDPMELALNPSRSPRTAEYLKTQFGRYPGAETLEQVPPHRQPL